MDITKTTFINQLPEIVQQKIKNNLLLLIGEKETETAMNGRICDIEELISFDQVLKLWI